MQQARDRLADAEAILGTAHPAVVVGARLLRNALRSPSCPFGARPCAVDTRIITKKQRLSEAPSILVLGPTPDRRHRGHVPITTEQMEKAEEAFS
jgi:hypothetical protein